MFIDERRQPRVYFAHRRPGRDQRISLYVLHLDMGQSGGSKKRVLDERRLCHAWQLSARHTSGPLHLRISAPVQQDIDEAKEATGCAERRITHVSCLLSKREHGSSLSHQRGQLQV